MKQVVNIFQLLLILLGCIVVIPVAILVGLISKKGMKWVGMKMWSPLLLGIVGARATVIGKEKLDSSTPAIYVANHSSHFDIPVLYAYFDFFLHFIAKKELQHMPLFGQACTMVDTIWIDRKNKNQAMDSMNKAGRLIKQGLNVISFPEGTRSKTGEIGMFKRGSFMLAQNSDIDIIPIAIKGTHPLNPPGTMRFDSSHVTIVIGEKIKTADFKDKTPEEFANYTQSVVKQMLDAID